MQPAFAPTPPAFGRLDDAGWPPLLNRLYADADASEVLRAVLLDRLLGDVAVVSSFGAESAVLLKLIADLDPATPVVFLETGKLFAETLSYRDRLVNELGLRDVRSVRPQLAALQREDPGGLLHRRDGDSCCDLRKTRPMHDALENFDAWISGRKWFQNDVRRALPRFDVDGHGRLKVNPLADWTADRVREFRDAHRLPPHPLVAKGYPSIGCEPCTTPVAPGEDVRAGRWRGEAKTECGIHLVNGRLVRTG